MLWLLIIDERHKELLSHSHLDSSVLSKEKQERDILIKHIWTLYLAPFVRFNTKIYLNSSTFRKKCSQQPQRTVE